MRCDPVPASGDFSAFAFTLLGGVTAKNLESLSSSLLYRGELGGHVGCDGAVAVLRPPDVSSVSWDPVAEYGGDAGFSAREAFGLDEPCGGWGSRGVLVWGVDDDARAGGERGAVGCGE